MSYEFTKLSDVPVVAEFPEGANAVIETNGEIKRCPSSGGGGMSYDLVIKSEDAATYTLISGSVEDTAAKLLNNIPINIGLIVSVAIEGGEKVFYSYNCTTVQYYAGIIAAMFHEIAGSTTTLGISSDGTITKEG